MAWRASKDGIDANADLARETASRFSGGTAATIVSAVALIFSGYSLWDTSLKSADIRVFVPRIVEYAAPYQNSNFEMIAVPVTLANEGAQSGTVLHMDLAVTDPRTGATKHFYAAQVGVWSMERTRTRSYTGFAPLTLAGRESRTDPILFYTRGEEEKPEQIIREVGPYNFTLTVTQAEREGPLGIGKSGGPISVSFERVLPFYDARSFNEGTIHMHAADWKTSASPSKD